MKMVKTLWDMLLSVKCAKATLKMGSLEFHCTPMQFLGLREGYRTSTALDPLYKPMPSGWRSYPSLWTPESDMCVWLQVPAATVQVWNPRVGH